ncbi:MAG TPA: hypothetical protein DIT55_09690 [Spirochaetaceae bacterium]|nr:hypothetical protein [Spirochaetaceae bacterium]
MSDNYPVEKKDLTEKGTKGIMSAGAGIGLLGINALLGIPVLGWVLSAGLLALGAVGLFGKTKTDKVSGSLLSVAGVAGLSTIFLPGLAHSLLSLGGIGLLLYGLVNIGGFLAGLRKKS